MLTVEEWHCDGNLDVEYIPHWRSIRVVVYQEEGRPTQPFRKYIGDLVHEMLHAFSEIFTCHCNEFTKHGNTIARRKMASHGEDWEKSISAIQSTTIRELGQWVDVGVLDSVNQERLARERRTVTEMRREAASTSLEKQRRAL